MNKIRTVSFSGLVTALCVLIVTGTLLAQSMEANLVKDLKWRNIGPANMVGRISDFEALDTDFTFVLVAGASGGVFKSTNAGTTWEPIFDKYGSASIGDVAIFQKDPNIIWVGTGEECSRNSVAWGDGVYKSTDGGKTFTNMGLKDTHSTGKIIIHPDNPDIVYVASPGHTWGYTGDRGLFKTIDGGKTWTKLTTGLPNDGKTGAIDMAMDPRNPSVIYVSFWQRLRQPWRFDSGGPNGGIFKTTNGGTTWTKLTRGLPTGELGRIGLAISRSKPNVLMAVVEHGFQPPRDTTRAGGGAGFAGGGGGGGGGQRPPTNPDYLDMTKLGSGIYRSEDGGATWQLMNRTNNRPFYYSHIYINPLDDKLIYFLTTNLYYSEDGGKTLKTMGGLHPDFHTMWLDPTNKNRYYVGQDGGASLTHDHGTTNIYFDNLCFAQFYAVSADMRDPYYVYGGLQDNGCWGGPSMSRERSVLTDFWFSIGGGDGFHTQNDPTNWRIVYSESQGGSIQRYNVETRQSQGIGPSQRNITNWTDYFPTTAQTTGAGAAGGRGGVQFRFNWSSPILISPHNPSTIYFGGNYLFKSIDRGDHWQIVSPDLTTNNPEKTRPQGNGGLTSENTGSETHCTIITISESSIKPGLVWVGTDDGNVQITKNGGAVWENVRQNVPGVPDGIWVSRIEASHFNEGTCYLTFDGHRSDNFKPYVFKTTDYGKTWTNISNNIPDGQPVYVIREDLKNRNLLFLGTEFGIFFSINGGKTWTDMKLNMPTVAFHDLLIHPRDNDLIAATHGRGIWIMDDISALQQATEGVLAGDAYLFDNGRVGTRWLRISREGQFSRGNFYFEGENPSGGALIHYYLGTKPSGPVTIEITDGTGLLSRMYVINDPKLGINRLSWDMRFDQGPVQIRQTITGLLNQAEQQPTLTAEQKTQIQSIRSQLAQAGDDRQKLAELQAAVSRLLPGGAGRGGIGGGAGAFAGAGGGRGGAGGGGGNAEPGTYGVKMTVDGKTYYAKVKVRLDPIQAGGER